MDSKTETTGTDSVPPSLPPLIIYIWAIHGPFKSGCHSALTMAKAVYIEKGEEGLNGAREGIIAHEEKYNHNRGEWEAWRKEFIRNNLSEIGGKKAELLKEAEVLIQNISNSDPCIQRVSELLSGEDDEPEAAEQSSPYNQSVSTGSSLYVSLQEKRKDIEEPVDIFDRVCQRFVSVTTYLTVLIYIVIFFSCWGVLIAGNFILGLAFGWIPALIVTFMASIFHPLLFLLSALFLLLVVSLLVWALYNILV